MEKANCLRCRFRHKDNGNCTAVGGFCTAVPSAHCPLLQEYLDTGLTPGDIKELLDMAASKTDKVLRLKEELHAIKNELCQYCGKDKQAHNGTCDGCKWREM